MKLAEKGRFVPRPTLTGYAELVAQQVGSWPGIHPRTHWRLGDEHAVDGADFYFGDEELGHIHLDGTVHVPQAPAVAEALLVARLARRFPWADDWVVTRVRSSESACHASWLFQLNLDFLRGTAESLLLRRVSRASTGAAGVRRSA